MEKFKGNATYFGRKSGSLEDVVEKINKANPKPEVFDLRNESEEYKKVKQAGFNISLEGMEFELWERLHFTLQLVLMDI